MKLCKRVTQLRTIIDPKAPWKLTLRNWSFRPYTDSASNWRKVLARAKSGEPEAEFAVGERYADGCRDRRRKIIVKRSPKKAVEWLRRAAEHGNSSAQNNLGNLLSNGLAQQLNRRHEGLSYTT